MPEPEAPTPTQSTPAPEPTITLPKGEVERLFAQSRKVEQFETEMTAREQAARDKAIAEAATSARAAVEQVRKEGNDALEQMRQTWLDESKERAIADAMAGAPLIGDDAIRQVKTLLSMEFEARLENGKAVVRHRTTGQTGVDTIKSRLATHEFAHFLKPSTHGGTAQQQGAPPQAGAPAASHADRMKDFLTQTYKPVAG